MNTNPIDWLPGKKSYLVAAGLAGLALYQFSIGDYQEAVTSLMAAAGIIFARRGATREREAVQMEFWAAGGRSGDARD